MVLYHKYLIAKGRETIYTVTRDFTLWNKKIHKTYLTIREAVSDTGRELSYASDSFNTIHYIWIDLHKWTPLPDG